MPGNRPHYGRWPQHDFPPFKKLRPQSVTSRIQPGSDVIVCAEMDEQWGYVGAKSRQRWLFYAYDRPRRRSSVANVRYLTINLFKYPDKNIQSGSNE
jgi:insertion element IS1 protein InsB